MNHHPIEATPAEATDQAGGVEHRAPCDIVRNRQLWGRLAIYCESDWRAYHKNTNERWWGNFHLVLLLEFMPNESLHGGWLKCGLMGEKPTGLQLVRLPWSLRLHNDVVTERNVRGESGCGASVLLGHQIATRRLVTCDDRIDTDSDSDGL